MKLGTSCSAANQNAKLASQAWACAQAVHCNSMQSELEDCLQAGQVSEASPELAEAAAAAAS